MLEAVRDEYGTAIIAFLQHIVGNIQAIQEEWRKYRKNFDQASGTVDRVMSRFFMVNFAGALAYSAGILPEDPTPPLNKLFEKISIRYKEASENPKMIEILRKYIVENSHKIYSIKNQLCREIVGVAILSNRQNLGTPEECSGETVEFVLLAGPLHQHLGSIGCSIKEIIKALKEEGLFGEPDVGRGLQKRVMHPFLNKRVGGYPINARIMTYE